VTSEPPRASERLLWTRVLTRGLGLRRGRDVIIVTWEYSLAAAEAIAGEASRLGIRPTILYQSERSFAGSPAKARRAASYSVGHPELAAASACDAVVVIPGPGNLRYDLLSPAAHQAHSRWSTEWTQVLRERSVPSVFLHSAASTPQSARWMGVDPARWKRESLSGGLVEARYLQRLARPVARQLTRGKRALITHPNGTHLELGLLGRPAVVDDGVVDAYDLRVGRNWTTVPSGVVEVAVDEQVAEGRILSNRPSWHRRGLTRGIEWTFRRGRLARYRLAQGLRLFEDAYLSGGRNRDRPGILSVGLNPRVHDAPYLQDVEQGTITLYLGRNEDIGGRSGGSYRDYIILRGARVSVDGHPVRLR
jgi:leucyl aminopeptidase (aminopeptidase T)